MAARSAAEVPARPLTGVGLYQRIWSAVRRVPRGRVVTYGDVAAWVGCGARQVGYALAALPDRPHRVPWHRVVGSHGMVSQRRSGDGALRQRMRLETEGIVFSQAGRLDLQGLRWSYPDSPAPGAKDAASADARDGVSPRRRARR